MIIDFITLSCVFPVNLDPSTANIMFVPASRPLCAPVFILKFEKTILLTTSLSFVSFIQKFSATLKAQRFKKKKNYFTCLQLTWHELVW